MAFNPKDSKAPVKTPVFNIGKKGGKLGVVITPLQRIEQIAKSEIEYQKSAPLKPIVGKLAAPGEKKEYYMEWWVVGTEHKLIEQGNFHTANIKYFLQTFLKTKKYTVVYLENVKTGNVVRDARSTLR